MTWGWDFSTINPTLRRGLDSWGKHIFLARHGDMSRDVLLAGGESCLCGKSMPFGCNRILGRTVTWMFQELSKWLVNRL